MWVLGGLSPRRRALVVGVAVLVAVVVAVVAVRVVGGGGDGDAPPQDRPGPVVLVPGYGGGAGGLRVLADRLRRDGRQAFVLDLPGDGTGDLREQARALDRRVGEALRGGAPSVDVVGHSAGGVVARLWAAEHDGARKARRIVSLGSPHRGAQLAAAGTAFGAAACPAACRQLAPGSDLLRDLGGRVPGRPAWMSVWTSLDETVTPPESARLGGAVNVVVQDVCPNARTGHADLPSDPYVMGIVLRALGTAPLTEPSGCAPA
ncbi:esterase/lipase family protein [Actinomadura miaoliensis]|uniref:AB hydrolase-1 domain-containing protein n=1 Tax=Actinomadura miaoliensis TaxID=430685 RepID=A0ABP7W3L2_9ACTN